MKSSRRTMTCRESIDRLMDYLDQRLAARERARLLAHLEICPRCAEFLLAYRRTPEILRRATDIEMPESLKNVVRLAIDESSG